MTKVISIIFGLLCVCATYAIYYASPYKGSVSRHSTHIVHSGMASMPTASMGSVSAGMMSSGSSSNSQREINYSTTGFATCATTIRGGVTADMTYNRIGGGPRKVSGPGVPEEDCHCYDNINNTTGEPGADDLCDQCGHEIGNCECDPCNCVPVEFDWSVLAFLSLLSFAYIAYKKRQKMSNFA